MMKWGMVISAGFKSELKTNIMNGIILKNNLVDLATNVFVKINGGLKDGACKESKEGNRSSRIAPGDEGIYYACDDGDTVNEIAVIFEFEEMPVDKVKGVKIALFGDSLVSQIKDQDGNLTVAPIPHHVSFYQKLNGIFVFEIHYSHGRNKIDINPNIQHP